MPTQSHTNKRRTDGPVSGTSNASGKRSRVSRACDQCRTAREKCDGQVVCSTCSASRRACTYTANPKKRGIQPGYIRTLELALTWLFNNSEAEALLNKKIAQEGLSSILLGKDTKESNKLHKSWRKSKFCKDIDKLLSGENIGEDDSRSPESDDPDTETEDTVHQETLEPTLSNSLVPPIPIPPTGNVQFSDLSPLGTKVVSLPANRWRLFDIYFAYTHCWFPICEKHDVLKLSYSYPEEGLILSPSMPESGEHAELWSLLALASMQDRTRESRPSPSRDRSDTTSTWHIYDIARSLIPLETNAFEVGHVKALLLLALVNMSQSAYGAAWLLVSHATRIIVVMEENRSSYGSRFRHTFAGCYVLDNLVSLQLRLRPYLESADIERVGKVYEDGLEEWQPWSGCLNPSNADSNPRTPVLSLSTFNCLVEVVGILSLTAVVDNSRNILQEVIGRVELWKASLPSTFDHIRSESTLIPPAPPALLLQAVYSCCSLIIYSSQAWVQRTLEILEKFRDVAGLMTMPPIISSLLDIVEKNRAFLALDDRSRFRFQELRTKLRVEWQNPAWVAPAGAQNVSPAIRSQPNIAEPGSAHSGRFFGASMPTPDSIQISYNTPTGRSSNARTTSSLLDDLLPDMNPTSVDNRPSSMGFPNAQPMPDRNAPQFDHTFNPPAFQHRNSTASRDIESFFDELASLDGAEGLGTHPQFMQNLGFAPDANIADLFASDLSQQYNPLVSPYIQQDNVNTTELPGHYFDQT